MIEIVNELLSSLLLGACICACIWGMFVLYSDIARNEKAIARLKELNQTKGESHEPLPRRRRPFSSRRR